ncbi:3'(2'),5'-bisphosphate nucleotidase CysQ [Parasphingorhabdus sp. DH2-15]|uniref:3'(2'),5'-bisphosphate nucleotidase CysQ n=1 Tax=Parasphingorhabdus sp. DH2-15 TaxID=3444112 RepID=UPI003F6862A7
MSESNISALPGPAAALTSEHLARIAFEAGQIIMPYFLGECEVSEKEDSSPVTQADQDAEALILRELKALCPALPVLAEEEVAAGRIPDLGNVFACVDPLDGTREFVGKRKDFTVNIGIIAHGKTVGGVIYAPAHGTLYVAHPEAAPWKAVLPYDAIWAIPTERETLSTRPRADKLVAIASRSHRTAETDAILDDYDAAEIISAGSSLKFCLVAEGKADFYPRMGRTMEWDTSAGQAIVEAAGGRVTLEDGKTPLAYQKAGRGYDNPHFLVTGW